MNTAINPSSGEVEPCTRTEPPFFEGDLVGLSDSRATVTVSVTIDTVDVDGDDSLCRVRYLDRADTYIFPVERLRA